tara:strand:- start:5801 stop:6910 length:1110 start_codon:yes stop_codon:yes gene_type:complete
MLNIVIIGLIFLIIYYVIQNFFNQKLEKNIVSVSDSIENSNKNCECEKEFICEVKNTECIVKDKPQESICVKNRVSKKLPVLPISQDETVKKKIKMKFDSQEKITCETSYDKCIIRNEIVPNVKFNDKNDKNYKNIVGVNLIENFSNCALQKVDSCSVNEGNKDSCNTSYKENTDGEFIKCHYSENNDKCYGSRGSNDSYVLNGDPCLEKQESDCVFEKVENCYENNFNESNCNASYKDVGNGEFIQCHYKQDNMKCMGNRGTSTNVDKYVFKEDPCVTDATDCDYIEVQECKKYDRNQANCNRSYKNADNGEFIMCHYSENNDKCYGNRGSNDKYVVDNDPCKKDEGEFCEDKENTSPWIQKVAIVAR